MNPDSTATPDGVLLARYCDHRDDHAFAAIVDRHQGMVRAVCRRIGGEADLDDCVQAVFLVLALRARGLTSRTDLGGWLHIAARQVALRQLAASLARRRREGNPAPAEPAAPALAEPDPFLAHIDAALADLPDGLRQPLVLHYLEGIPAEAVAERLGLAPKALGMRLTRGRRRLRALLERVGAALEPAALATMLAGMAASGREPGMVPGIALAKTAAALGEGAVGGLAREVAAALAWTKAKIVTTAIAASLVASIAIGGVVTAVSVHSSEDVTIAPGVISYASLAGLRFAAPSVVVVDGRPTLTDDWNRLLQLDPPARARVDRILQTAYVDVFACLATPPPILTRGAASTWTLSWEQDGEPAATRIQNAMHADLASELGPRRWAVLEGNLLHRLFFLGARRLPSAVTLQQHTDSRWTVETSFHTKRSSASSSWTGHELPAYLLPLLMGIPEFAQVAVPAREPILASGVPGLEPAGIPLAEVMRHPLGEALIELGAKGPCLRRAAKVTLGLDATSAAAVEATMGKVWSEFVATLERNPPKIVPSKADGHELQFPDLRQALKPLREMWRSGLSVALGAERTPIFLAATEQSADQIFWRFGEHLQIIRLRKTTTHGWELGHASDWGDGDTDSGGGHGGNLGEVYRVFLRFLP